MTALQTGKLGKGLKKFLTEEVVDKGKAKESLVVIDPHLGAFFHLSIPSRWAQTSFRPRYHEETQHKRQRRIRGLKQRPLAWN